MSKAYSYYKLYITDFRRDNSIQNFANIAEFRIYDKDGNNIAKQEGVVYTASSEVSTGKAEYAFDDNINTQWHTVWNGSLASTTNWLQVQLPDSVSAMSIGIVGGQGQYLDFINTFCLYGSNDGETWDVLLEQSDIYSGWSLGVERVFELPEPSLKNYNTIEEIIAGVENSTKLVDNTKYDENSYTISGLPDYVKYKGVSVSTIYANGNSWIGFDSESEHFKFNRRDAAMYNLWMEEGTFLDTYRFFRIRWGGVCKYNAYGDPYFQTFDLIIFDTGDVMFYAVDIPTSYYDGTFAFADVEYNAPTTDSRYVTFYAQADGTYRTEYAPIEFVQDMVKYLVRDGATIYTVTDGMLVEVTGELSASLFTEYGVDTIPDGALLMTLNAPEVLCWTNVDELPVLTATVQGVPIGEHDIISDNIPIGHSSIYGISSVEANASDGATFLLSFDGGMWMSYTEGKWSASDVGMTASELIAVPTQAWSSVVNSAQNMRLKVSIDGVDTVTQVKFDFSNEPPVVIAGESEV